MIAKLTIAELGTISNKRSVIFLFQAFSLLDCALKKTTKFVARLRYIVVY